MFWEKLAAAKNVIEPTPLTPSFLTPPPDPKQFSASG